MVGLNDLKGLFQPKCFYDSMVSACTQTAASIFVRLLDLFAVFHIYCESTFSTASGVFHKVFNLPEKYWLKKSHVCVRSNRRKILLGGKMKKEFA